MRARNKHHANLQVYFDQPVHKDSTHLLVDVALLRHVTKVCRLGRLQIVQGAVRINGHERVHEGRQCGARGMRGVRRPTVALLHTPLST